MPSVFTCPLCGEKNPLLKDKKGRAFARCDPGCGMILFAPGRAQPLLRKAAKRVKLVKKAGRKVVKKKR